MEGFVDNVKSEGFYFSTAQGCVGQVYFLNVLSARPWQVFTHIQGAFVSVGVCASARMLFLSNINGGPDTLPV